MFRVHHITTHDISIKNLILLFLTIVMWFASVITLADINIPSSIDNARQTIGRITITEDGTDSTVTEMDISSWGIYINTGILDPQSSFSGKVLGLDENGYVIYVDSQNLVTSWSSGGGWGWTGGYRTWVGDDIYNTNNGNIGIWTSTMSGKLHITSSGETNIYIEETNPINAANLNLKTINNRWMVGAYDQRFYIGMNSSAFLNIITGGQIGIGTTSPKAPLQVIGNLIVWAYDNEVIGENSTVLWGKSNTINGDYSFIWWGSTNRVLNDAVSSFIWWGSTNYLSGGEYNFIWGWTSNKMLSGGSHNFLGWGISNEILTGKHNFLGWGDTNKIITSEYSSVDGGRKNIIQSSNSSTIVGWRNNFISWSNYSLVWGIKSAAYHDNSFVRNSDIGVLFTTITGQTFIINAVKGVWIRTNNPKWDLHIAGKGVLVLEPQTNNPQLSTGSCNTTWSIVFHETSNKLCFCDWSERKFIDGASPCIF